MLDVPDLSKWYSSVFPLPHELPAMTDASNTGSLRSSFWKRIGSLVALLLIVSLGACQSGDNGEEDADAPRVVEVTAADYAFGAPDSIPSGWTTFRFVNRGEELHVFDLQRLPNGKTYQDLQREYLRPADSILQARYEGELEQTESIRKLKELEPQWMGDMEGGKGVGVTSPGYTAETTVRLDPGIYYMKCFTFTPDTEVHWTLGMRRPLVVTQADSKRSPPTADVRVDAANYTIEMKETVEEGRKTFALHFGDRPEARETPLQDLHLVRLEGQTTVEEVAEWVATMPPYQTPAPAPLLGGAHAAPPGQTAYVTADLKPGTYAWISTATPEKGMQKTFTVE